ncbi:MAG: Smr/MutS family protein [Oscillospiraceae bacterium]|nr:Smr/MutS family protein [Oscillospiraceae bacterium]
MYQINLEDGMPSVENARLKLDQALRTAKARRYTAMKIIHGYGSSGKGGAIKRDVQSYLAGKKRQNIVREFVKGEDFTPFNAACRTMIDQCPDLSHDIDYSRGNDGITMVLL